MKKFIVLALSFTAIFSLSAFNVKDFGAKGDGVTDDTEAIQKALTFIAKRIKYDRFRTEDNWNKGGTETHVDELKFPAGTYLVSSTLLADGSVSLRGEKGKTIIKMTDPEQDVIYCRIYRRFLVDGMIFDGGYTQIDVWSRNWNASSVHITDCEFRNSAAPAFRNFSWRRKEKKIDWSKGLAKLINKIKMIPSHEVTFKNGKAVLKRSTYENSISWFSSNIITIRDCKFINCAKAFENNADGTVFENCSFVADPASPGAVGLVRTGSAPNMLTMKNCDFYAPPTKEKQIWFTNDGFYLTLRGCSFKSAQPMPLLEQNANKIPHASTAGNIIVANCKFDQAGETVPLVIIKRVPSYFMFRNNDFTGKTPDLFDWQVKNMDLKYFMRDSYPGKHQGVLWNIKHKYHFIFGRNKNVNINLPEIIKLFTHQEVPQLYTEPEKFPQLTEKFAGEIKAADFGVIADNKTDNADALERALDAASKSGKTLIIPTGRVLVSRTIKLPASISIRGEGMPVIQGYTRDGYDLFSAEKVKDIRFRNLILRNGKHLLNAKLDKDSEVISIRDVLHIDSGRLSLLISGKDNNCLLDLCGSLWNGSGGIDTSAKYNAVTLCWFANNYWMDDMAFFTARNGTTHFQNGFFVPYVAKNIKRKNLKTGEVKIWPLGGNLRWVDNCGTKVFMYDCRGGGEAGGYCSYYHTAPGGFGIIEGGIARMTYKYTKNTIFYVKEAPEWLLISAVGGYPIHTVLGVRQRIWMKESDKVKDFPIFILGSMNPQDGPEN